MEEGEAVESDEKVNRERKQVVDGDGEREE